MSDPNKYKVFPYVLCIIIGGLLGGAAMHGYILGKLNIPSNECMYIEYKDPCAYKNGEFEFVGSCVIVNDFIDIDSIYKELNDFGDRANRLASEAINIIEHKYRLDCKDTIEIMLDHYDNKSLVLLPTNISEKQDLNALILTIGG